MIRWRICEVNYIGVFVKLCSIIYLKNTVQNG